jgi:hypothetical protein
MNNFERYGDPLRILDLGHARRIKDGDKFKVEIDGEMYDVYATQDETSKQILDGLLTEPKFPTIRNVTFITSDMAIFGIAQLDSRSKDLVWRQISSL